MLYLFDAAACLVAAVLVGMCILNWLRTRALVRSIRGAGPAGESQCYWQIGAVTFDFTFYSTPMVSIVVTPTTITILSAGREHAFEKDDVSSLFLRSRWSDGGLYIEHRKPNEPRSVRFGSLKLKQLGRELERLGWKVEA